MSCSANSALTSAVKSPHFPSALTTRASGCLLWHGHRVMRTTSRWPASASARRVSSL